MCSIFLNCDVAPEKVRHPAKEGQNPSSSPKEKAGPTTENSALERPQGQPEEDAELDLLFQLLERFGVYLCREKDVVSLVRDWEEGSPLPKRENSEPCKGGGVQGVCVCV